ncbi:Zinc finger, C3HC [Salix suchowensis]|nr:Zinc finger, C3HC [Salix suchowensis]
MVNKFQEQIFQAIGMRKGQTCSVIQNSIGAQEKCQGTTDGVQVPVNSEVVAYSTGKDPKQLAVDKTLGFDPIRQHRHYCTWIVSTSSWAQKEFSLPSTNSPPPSSVIKVDNPIASVRKLFMSPIKRTKLSSGSS